MTFFRAFLSDGLKDSPTLFKGVLTGILKVAQEGIFSGLNHLETHTVLSNAMTQRFGFTEREVEELALAAGRQGDLEALQRAVAQLVDRNYSAEVYASGATVHQFAVVFNGKRCSVALVPTP